MSSINKNEIRLLLANSVDLAQDLEAQIATLQSQLLALRERIKVYDELISGTTPVLPPRSFTKIVDTRRGQRSTKTEMITEENLSALCWTKCPMQPRELLVLAQRELGESFEAHHLRAVLRKYKDIFAPSPEQHGLWMTLAPVSLAAVQSKDWTW